MNQTNDSSEAISKIPKPPKKPLSPYMKYCKSIWKQVKGNNPSMSICQAGASIGRLWRELSDSDKKKYMDSFAQDKAEYEVALQCYLKMTGLTMSEVIKTKSRKKDSPAKSRASSASTPASVSKPVLRSSTLSQVPVGLATTGQAISMTLSGTGQAMTTTLSGTGQDFPFVRSSGGRDLAMTASLLSSLPHINQMLGAQCTSIINSGTNNHNFVTVLGGSVGGNVLQETDRSTSINTVTGFSLLSDGYARYKTEQNQEVMNSVEDNTSGQLSRTMMLPAGRQVVSSLDLQDDDIEDGEVVKNSKRIALFYESIASRVFDSETTKHQTASAHNLFNSYAYNPWIDVRQNAKSDSPTIFSRELMLQTELDHLQLLLNDKTNEAEELTERLRQAQSTIELLKLEMGCLDTSVTLT